MSDENSSVSEENVGTSPTPSTSRPSQNDSPTPSTSRPPQNDSPPILVRGRRPRGIGARPRPNGPARASLLLFRQNMAARRAGAEGVPIPRAPNHVNALRRHRNHTASRNVTGTARLQNARRLLATQGMSAILNSFLPPNETVIITGSGNSGAIQRSTNPIGRGRNIQTDQHFGLGVRGRVPNRMVPAAPRMPPPRSRLGNLNRVIDNINTILHPGRPLENTEQQRIVAPAIIPPREVLISMATTSDASSDNINRAREGVNVTEQAPQIPPINRGDLPPSEAAVAPRGMANIPHRGRRIGNQVIARIADQTNRETLRRQMQQIVNRVDPAARPSVEEDAAGEHPRRGAILIAPQRRPIRRRRRSSLF